MSAEIWETLGEEVTWDQLSKEQQLRFEGLVKDGGDDTPHGLKVREFLANKVIEPNVFLDVQNHPEFNEPDAVTFADSVSVEEVPEIPTVASVMKNNNKEELLTWAKSLEIEVTEDNNKKEIAEKIVEKLSK